MPMLCKTSTNQLTRSVIFVVTIALTSAPICTGNESISDKNMTNKEDAKKIAEMFISIAVIGAGDEIAMEGIKTIFSQEEIEYYIEGSIVYHVLVHKDDKKRAIKILKKSKVLSNRWHQFNE